MYANIKSIKCIVVNNVLFRCAISGVRPGDGLKTPTHLLFGALGAEGAPKTTWPVKRRQKWTARNDGYVFLGIARYALLVLYLLPSMHC